MVLIFIEQQLLLNLFKFSFQMLASKKTAAPSWPQLSSNRTSSNAAPVKLINVTGSALKAPVYRRMHGNSESEPECEDYVPAPSFNTTFKDSLAVALEKAANSFENTGKKNQKITFM